jgi:GTP-binding protein
LAKSRRAEWRPLIEEYVRTSSTLRGIVLLLDARRDLESDDRDMLDYLASTGKPTIVAITKLDKFGPRAGAERVAGLTADLGLDPDQVIGVSAHTGQGRDDLAGAIMSLVAAGET